MSFIIVKNYSGITANKTLWQVMSRPIKYLVDARHELNFLQKKKNPEIKFRIVKEIKIR